MQLMFLNAITFLAATCSLYGQAVTVEMEPITADGSITDVTLYRGRASITRTAELDLTMGGWSVFFENLPHSAALSSVQASVVGNAKLIAVDTSSFHIEKNNNELLEEINREIEAVEDKIKLAKADEQSLQMQSTYLETLVQRSSSDKEQAVDLHSFKEQLAFIGEHMAILEEQKLTNKTLQGALNNKRNTLVKRRNSIADERRIQQNAVVDLIALSDGSVTVELTYLVQNASWEPLYAIRATENAESITIDYDANISQFSGEDWKDVNLILSTAQPQRSASPPKLSPWYVDIEQPQPPPPSSELTRRGETVSYQYAKDAGASRSRLDAEEVGAELGLAVASASVQGEGPAVSFALPRTVTVPSDKNGKQKTAIGSIATTASLFRVAVPMLTDSVYIRSEVRNESPFILLPGVASIFHGSDFVGRTTVPTIAPNESFPLDLGIDPKVTATRTLLEKKTSSKGLFGSSKETLFDYRVTISNGHDSPLNVQLWDRIPVSRNAEIAVEMKGQTAALSTDTTYLESERPLGLLRWDLEIPATSTGDSSFVLTWQVDVARGKNVDITPLPE
ncbi:MAG: mucoidy inhibitor MuiA family protein [Phycisphaerales bacterium]|jgi:uncharacterized protein (TIGR02231 family)|nr:mucoidy inhibitor MuiA family protein [Phycisphaerales bacterium]